MRELYIKVDYYVPCQSPAKKVELKKYLQKNFVKISKFVCVQKHIFSIQCEWITILGLPQFSAFPNFLFLGKQSTFECTIIPHYHTSWWHTTLSPYYYTLPQYNTCWGHTILSQIITKHTTTHYHGLPHHHTLCHYHTLKHYQPYQIITHYHTITAT